MEWTVQVLVDRRLRGSAIGRLGRSEISRMADPTCLRNDSWMRTRGQRLLLEPGLARRVMVLAGAVLILLVAGIVGYTALGESVDEATYLTVLALTTEGFGGGTVLTGDEKLFTAGLAVLGVTVFFTAIGVIGVALIEGRIGLGGRRRMERRIEKLRDHYIICAYGRVGRSVAREFEAEGVPFVVIDPKADLEADLQRDGVSYLVGNSASEDVLRRAGLERARGLVCAVDSDAENLYITLVARSLNPNIDIVARAGEAQSADRLYRAGANRVVSPYVTSGRRMALLVLRPHVLDLLEISHRGDEQYRLEELLVTDDSDLVGHTLKDASGSAVPLLLRRTDGSVLPNPPGDTRLVGGDVLVLFGDGSALRPVENR